ncbi:MAG: MFS transporter [Promethearchaeota archaeon]
MWKMTNPLLTYISDVRGLDWRPKVVLGAQTTNAIANGMISFVIIFYVLSLGGTVVDFGILNGFLVVCAIIFGIASGIFSDRFRRDYMIWIGSAIMFFAILILIGRSLQNLMLGMIFIGIGNGLINPAFSGWMADITSNENRDSIFSFQFMINTAFMSIGAIFAGTLFFALGDSADIIYLVMLSALICFIPFMLAMFIIRDVRYIKKVSSPLNVEGVKELVEEIPSAPVQISRPETAKVYEYSSRTPYIMLISQLVIAFGAGLSIPFIPLFLSQRYMLELGAIGYLEGATAIATGIGAVSSSLVSKRFGRVKVILVVQLIATFVLLSLVFHLPLVVVIPFLLIRSSFMNMANPLINTVVMSSISEKLRSTWSMVMQLGWQILNVVGQVVGSLIILGLSFENSFIITAVIYFVSVLSLLLIKERITTKNLESDILTPDLEAKSGIEGTPTVLKAEESEFPTS